jgi:glutaredoxin
MLVEVLTFEGCPHGAAALQLARRVAAEGPGATEVRMLNVEMEQAEVVRFLGSPSIRVDGHDIEPGADARHSYSFGCRLHATADGLQPLPSEQWLRDALRVPSSPA